MAIIKLPKTWHPDFPSQAARFNAPIKAHVKPKGRVKINYNHRMGRGITGCWLMNEGAGTIVRDLAGRHEDGVIATSSWGRDESSGNIIFTNAEDTHIVIPNYTADKAGTIIFKIRGVPPSAFNGTQRVMGHDDAFEFGFNGSEGRPQWFAASGSFTTSVHNYQADRWYVVISTWRFDTGGPLVLYVDGEFDAETANANDQPPGEPKTMTFGIRTGSSSSQWFRGDYEFIIQKNYKIEEGEVWDWNQSPYDFLEPEMEGMYFTPAGGSIGELAAAENVTFSDLVTLIGTGELVISESITVSELATLLGRGALTASENITFSDLATLIGKGALVASENISFTQRLQAHHGSLPPHLWLQLYHPLLLLELKVPKYVQNVYHAEAGKEL